jgi:hypothetical protein
MKRQLSEDELAQAIAAHERRRKVFESEGMYADRAFELADQLLDRDLDPLDNRRICFECAKYVNKKCTAITDRFKKPTMQMRFILQNCPEFLLKGK